MLIYYRKIDCNSSDTIIERLTRVNIPPSTALVLEFLNRDTFFITFVYRVNTYNCSTRVNRTFSLIKKYYLFAWLEKLLVNS